MKMKNNGEFVGRLSAVKTEGGKHKLTFLVSKDVEIPDDAISIHKLHSLHGKRIGILYLGGVYKLRKISE